jgi:hypothetical protein
MVFAAVAAATSLDLCALTGPVLVVEDVTGGRELLRECMRPGQTFTLEYVHSSEHVPVRGVFRLEDDGAFTVVETAFGGFGPGLPALTTGDRWTIEAGMIVARDPMTRLPEMRVRVLPITRHRLRTARGADLDLSGVMGAGGAVRIGVR